MISVHIFAIVLALVAIGLFIWLRKEHQMDNGLHAAELDHTHHGMNAMMDDFNNYQVKTDRKIAEIEKLDEPRGALVASVAENSPSKKGGIKAGDIILEFDGKKINTMKKLPNVVASTEVGKSVELKIWRNKKLISKRLVLGRLETSEEFKETKPKIVKKDVDIQSLKIAVRDLNAQDITKRNLNKKTTGVVITEISNRSPLINLLSVSDIIIEVQKTSVKNSSDLNKIVNNIFKKGEKTLLLTIINKDNRRRYLGVKIN